VSLADWFFLLFAVLTVGGGLVVATTPRIIHAVFALLFAFSGVAGLYVLLQADFLAAAQIMVYVGGILVLLLFGVMLTHRVTEVDLKAAAIQRFPAAVICLAVLVVLLLVIHTTPWPQAEPKAWEGTARQLGEHIMTDYLLPFEAVSILLLGALMGAALLARAERKG
jgi:NADH-quinone oxidoreductase subunit J